MRTRSNRPTAIFRSGPTRTTARARSSESAETISDSWSVPAQEGRAIHRATVQSRGVGHAASEVDAPIRYTLHGFAGSLFSLALPPLPPVPVPGTRPGQSPGPAPRPGPDHALH